ncbi:MAG: hypothetical protein WD749_01030 [Phycisphaerales bacterium]
MTTHSRSSPLCLPAAALAGGLLLAGCVSDYGPRAPRTPASAAPDTLVPIASDFVDTDQNRFRDTTRVVVYVYADSGRYPIPVAADGAFEFRIENPAGERVAAWVFDREQTRAAMRQLAPGPGFVFELSLLAPGSGGDRVADSEGQLSVLFTPSHGSPISARPTAPLLIGALAPTALR